MNITLNCVHCLSNVLCRVKVLKEGGKTLIETSERCAGKTAEILRVRKAWHPDKQVKIFCIKENVSAVWVKRHTGNLSACIF